MASQLLFHLVYGPLVVVIVLEAHGIEYRKGNFYKLPNTSGYSEAIQKVVYSIFNRLNKEIREQSHPIINDMLIQQQPNPLVRRENDFDTLDCEGPKDYLMGREY